MCPNSTAAVPDLPLINITRPVSHFNSKPRSGGSAAFLRDFLARSRAQLRNRSLNRLVCRDVAGPRAGLRLSPTKRTACRHYIYVSDIAASMSFGTVSEGASRGAGISRSANAWPFLKWVDSWRVSRLSCRDELMTLFGRTYPPASKLELASA